MVHAVSSMLALAPITNLDLGPPWLLGQNLRRGASASATHSRRNGLGSLLMFTSGMGRRCFRFLDGKCDLMPVIGEAW